jgi:hypothetical protein
MITVILSLPKNMVFVALGTPSSEGTKGTKYAKVVAIGVLVVVTSKHPCPSHAINFGLLMVQPCSLREYMDPKEDGDCCQTDRS